MLTVIAQAGPAGWGTGLEWLLILSFVVPILLLAAIFWYGSRNTV